MDTYFKAEKLYNDCQMIMCTQDELMQIVAVIIQCTL